MEIDNLKNTIKKIVRKIQDYKHIYLKNETAVRSQLINPILNTLGWNTEDPSQVLPEEKTTEGCADYALIRYNKKKLFVEGKNLSVDIENYSKIQQLAKYSFAEGVDFGLLTNGQKWLLLRSYEKDTRLSDRILWVVDLLKDDIEKVVFRLKSVSYDNIKNLSLLIKKQDILSETWKALISTPDLLTIPVSNILKKHLPNQDSFSEEEIKDFTLMKLIELMTSSPVIKNVEEIKLFETTRIPYHKLKARPRRISIQDFSVEVRFATDVLVQTANYLLDNNLLDDIKIPIASGSRRYIINRKPLHQGGNSFRQPVKLNCGYYLETHNNSFIQIEYSRKLLKVAGLGKDALKLFF